MKNKKWINHSQKQASRNFGSDKIDLIQSAMIQCGFQVIQEPVLRHDLFSTPNKIRNPDLKIIFGDMIVYLESDGKIHGTLEQPTKQTVERNADFKKTGLNYFVINHETIKELKKILGITICTEDLIRFLSVYMILEKYTRWKQRAEMNQIENQIRKR